jgi:hypothetical protein
MLNKKSPVQFDSEIMIAKCQESKNVRKMFEQIVKSSSSIAESEASVLAFGFVFLSSEIYGRICVCYNGMKGLQLGV